MTRIVVVLLWAAALQAQSVQGVAVNSATHKPVAGATVQLVGPADEDEREIYRTSTDAAGRFHFERVAPGRYRAIADAQGFTRMLVARGPRVAVQAEGAPEVSIPMVPASVISGRVSDPDGDPLRYVSIDALQYVYRGGKKILDSVLSVRTDDRGGYRIFGLPPGRYYVRATLRARGSTAYSPLFFPASRDISQATQLEAAPGAELRSIDIVMRPDSLHSVSGRVVDAQTGQPVPEIYVIARLNGDTFANGAVQLTDSFTIGDLLPGKYLISAQHPGGNAPKAGRVSIWATATSRVLCCRSRRASTSRAQFAGCRQAPKRFACSCSPKILP
jgi:Carboxypeptidase regulatory-like domain